MRPGNDSPAWWVGVTLVLIGLTASLLTGWPGLAVAAAGLTTLALRALAHAHEEARGRPALLGLLVAAEVAFLAAAALAFGLLPAPAGLAWKAAAFAVAVQLVLGALALAAPLRPARGVLLGAGHAAVAAGTALLASGVGPSGPLALAYAAGFALLSLTALWARRERLVAWEPVLLATLVAGVSLAAGAHALPGAASEDAPRALAAAAGLGLVSFCVLAWPPHAPAWLRRIGHLPAAGLHGATFLVLLNAAFLPFAALLVTGARAALAVLTLFVLAAVLFEYGAVRHQARMRRAHDEPAPPLSGPVTVVVPSRDEADTLRESLAENLRLPEDVRFLLVPSVGSLDATVEVAREAAQRHPGRVRVHEGVSGSKAGDLNAAWRLIDTDLVLILDADETIDEASLGRGVRTMREHPEFGVLQGRKVSKAPEAGALARFVTAERRHSTGLDHPLYADRFEAGHFAGSAALLRREVPAAVGGWSEDALTEDIDLTMRLHLETGWALAYDARMVVRESDPADLRELLRQRTRWARGWAQCFASYFGRVVARRGRLGTGRALALAWMLFAAVSAPLFSLLPALVLLRIAGSEALLPLALALPLALLVLPARFASYTYSAWVDPVAPVPRTPRRLAELVLHAYAWVVFGWAVQFHAIYLELADAPRAWTITGKRAAADRLAPARRGRAQRT